MPSRSNSRDNHALASLWLQGHGILDIEHQTPRMTRARVAALHGDGGRQRSTGVPKGIRTPVAAVKGRCPRPLDDGDGRAQKWWSQAGSNRRPLACHASALPTELWPHLTFAPLRKTRLMRQAHRGTSRHRGRSVRRCIRCWSGLDVLAGRGTVGAHCPTVKDLLALLIQTPGRAAKIFAFQQDVATLCTARRVRARQAETPVGASATGRSGLSTSLLDALHCARQTRQGASATHKIQGLPNAGRRGAAGERRAHGLSQLAQLQTMAGQHNLADVGRAARMPIQDRPQPRSRSVRARPATQQASRRAILWENTLQNLGKNIDCLGICPAMCRADAFGCWPRAPVLVPPRHQCALE